ncbi:protein LTO1 homolog isoform 2-T2 [Spheniscus humboldti]
MAAASPSSDMFDEIVMAEERFHGEGYQEGYAEGSHVGVAEGRRYGSLHGAKIGSEIGCYLGFALTWQCLLQKCTDEKNGKKIRALDSLIGMIQKFPYEDPTYDKLQEDLEKIRGKFKQRLQVSGQTGILVLRWITTCFSLSEVNTNCCISSRILS